MPFLYVNIKDRKKGCENIMKQVKKITMLTLFAGLILPFYFYLVQAASIPASYDLRKSNPGNLAAHGNITLTPKDQGWYNSNYNVCWAFASLNALETHIQVKSNGTDNPVLSVRHLDYLTSKYYSSKGFSRSICSTGGVNLALRYFLNNDGPVLNSKSSLTKYPVWNSSGTITDGTNYYSKTLSSTEINTLDGYTPEYYVHKVVSFPSIVKVNGKAKYVPIDSSYAYNYSTGTDVPDAELLANRNKIKQHIMENGGVTCLTTPSARKIVNGISYNYTASNGGGHMVTIVGWDDNLDIKTKTNGALNPPGKGAYLILNSYGKHYGGMAQNDGFEWISYYDSIVEYCNFGYLEVDKTEKYVTATFSNSDLYGKIKAKVYSEIKGSTVAQSAYKSVSQSYYPVTANDTNRSVKMLDLAANTYSITVINMESLGVTSNDIKEFAKIAPNLNNVRLDGNKLKDISALANFKNLTAIKMNNNNIEDVSSIDSIIKNCTTFELNNQTISKTINNTDQCAYPNIFTKAKNSSSKLYSSSGFEFVNCKENSNGTGVIVTDTSKSATVKIKAGNAQGSVMTITVTGTVVKQGPTLSSISVTSPTAGSYKSGQEIKIVATFNENVYGNASKAAITATTAPKLKLKFGTGTERTATFSAVSGKMITYSIKIQDSDEGKLATTGYSGTVYNADGNSTSVANKTLGGYSITAVKSTVTLKKGDVDGNGTINLTDVLKLRRYIANSTKWSLTAEEKTRADVNEDGKINLSDVLKLRRYVAAQINASIKAKYPDWIW